MPRPRPRLLRRPALRLSEESDLDSAADRPFDEPSCSCPDLPSAAWAAATACFFAPERRLGRERLRRLFSPAGALLSDSDPVSLFFSGALRVEESESAGCFFLDGERRRAWGASPPLRPPSLLPRGRRRRRTGVLSSAVFFSPPSVRPPVLALTVPSSLFCEDLAGRRRLRVRFCSGSCSPPARLVLFEREARDLPLPASAEVAVREASERDLLPLERLRTGFRAESPEAFASDGFLLREPEEPEEPDRRFDDLSSPEPKPAPNSWRPDSDLFVSVFLRTAKIIS